MAINKRIDALTGTETTGHDFDGISELNTPLPKWWLYIFYATIAFSVVYMVLFPAVPWLSGYTKGLLGYSSRDRLVAQMAALEASRSRWDAKLAAASLEEIAGDPELLQVAIAGGRMLFANNCAPCHGTAGVGRPGGFPVLVDDEWIWGGTFADIQQTITHGIRNTNPDSRQSVMPAFGAEGTLTAQEIAAVADHVLSLSKAGPANPKGAEIFAENCTACHGDNGEGLAEVGGPNLTDAIWLYGNSRDAVIAQINRPRLGVMPPWNGRMSETEIKQAAIYVHSLGGGR